MFVVAIAMILLPLTYLAMIVALAYGVYYHAVHHAGILGDSGGFQGRLFIYIAPIAAGVVSILFMIKPFFSGAEEEPTTMALHPEDEPLVFDFVERICKSMGAPIPYRIEVDCQNNASASFTGGWSGLLGGKLTLRIGLPFAAGMTLREFTGVLAHEFGHFTQGFAMRFSFIIRSVSGWFARVVYERDSWDEWIETQKESTGGWVFILLQICRFFIWLSRRILWALMMIGQVLSCFLLRQMEFNADKYEARMAGASVFERTVRKLIELSIASQAAEAILGRAWNEKRLSDNYPVLLASRIEEIITPDVRAAIDKSIRESKTHFLATHPADSDRIQNAQREATEGIFRLECPATAIFRDFNSVARAASVEFYRSALGDQFRLGHLVSTDEVMKHELSQRDAFDALNRYFAAPIFAGELFFPCSRPILPVTDAAEVSEQLREFRNRIAAELPRRREKFQKLSDHRARKREGEQFLMIASRGLKPAADLFSSPIADQEEALHILQIHDQVAPELLSEYSKHKADQASRIELAMSLLASQEFRQNDPGREELWAHVQRMLGALHNLSYKFDRITELHEAVIAQRNCFIGLNHDDTNEKLINEVLQKNDQLRQLLKDLDEVHLKGMDYAFSNDQMPVPLGRMMIEAGYATQNPGGIFRVAEATVDKLMGYYGRLVGEIALVAEKVEQAMEIEPLPSDPAIKNP